jgi:molybdate transport system substrate-binding protein
MTVMRSNAQAGLLLLASLVAMLAAVACGGSSNSGKTPSAPPASTAGTGTAGVTNAPVSGEITVFAASSLTDAFTKLAADFKAANPDASVTFSFGGSPTLVTQLGQGANADILATADTKNMQNALDQALVVDKGTTFARNRLTIIVPKSNPGGIATPKDLSKSGLKLVLAQKDVPVGNYARQALDKFSADASYGSDFSQKVLANLVSDEANVKAVVTKIQLGEADAGIVYVTDVTAGVSGDITQIEIPDQYNVSASYPIAITKDASKPAVARAFIDYVLSDAGQAVLKSFGFVPATAGG